MKSSPLPTPSGPSCSPLPGPSAAPQEQGLDTWPLHTPACVARLVHPTDDDQAHTVLRLLEIGLMPGEPVRLVATGPWGRDPLAVRVGHTTFALRRHEAALVRVCAPGAWA